ncbi:SCO family protein [Noviherbaspirillum pedocola]|uniref:SCO family protein n=1 Tax=Noviherbaspirillum pedocola TaxID=2801341 RepID=A0A934SZF9_9BURK|nr:SCO family protein [Noviherbaspirillum pedocola]MBK4735827.1 SCO family protein [Noviherbaspirillum pedocola]
MRRRTFLLAPVALAAATLLPAGVALAHDPEHGHEQGHGHIQGHEHHHSAPDQSRPRRSLARYTLPDVALVRDDGRQVTLPGELDDGKPVFLAFIYTTCTTICPVTSQALASLQEALGADSIRVHMASVSIDPEQDTPARLRAYAQRYGAGEQWRHYTGTAQASVAVQRAFDAYGGDKMSHNPAFFIRPAPGAAWIRLDGFASAQDLLREYHAFAHGG